MTITINSHKIVNHYRNILLCLVNSEQSIYRPWPGSASWSENSRLPLMMWCLDNKQNHPEPSCHFIKWFLFYFLALFCLIIILCSWVNLDTTKRLKSGICHVIYPASRLRRDWRNQGKCLVTTISLFGGKQVKLVKSGTCTGTIIYIDFQGAEKCNTFL